MTLNVDKLYDFPLGPTSVCSTPEISVSIPSIANPQLSKALQARLDNKTKPLGSLGQLEDLALRLGLILGTLEPTLKQPQVLIFAADHGLTVHGISAYPAEVTTQMVENFLQGGAAISVLARQHGLAMTVIDAGVRQNFVPRPGLLIHKMAAGTQDSWSTCAMTPTQCVDALQKGREVVAQTPGNAIILGEMGIGNTSAATLLTARLAGIPLASCIGRGTGLDDAGLAHKHTLLQAVLDKHAQVISPMAALAAMGGFEIAMLCGAIIEAALQRRVIVVDGFITTAAVLVAAKMQATVLERCIFAHCSHEPGHAKLLAYLEVEPLLKLGLRLGEGSGAALVWPLLQSACLILAEMATFESAGVSDKICPLS